MGLNDLNDLNDTKIEQTFQRLVSSASAILKVEQEKENQRLEYSFVHLVDEAKVLLDRKVKGATANLRHQFLTFLEQVQIGLRENRQSELEGCSKFLETAKSVLYQDILRKVTHLDVVLKRARPAYERINIFSILNIARQEDPQSYFLAWLLNPDNPHGFGDTILRAFLKKACDIVGEFEYDSLEIANVTVVAQQGIQATAVPDGTGVPDIKIAGDNFVCVIENKVGAGETWKDGIPQTERYADYYTGQAKKDHKLLLLLYLVPPKRHEGEPAKQPSDNRFKQMLYSDIVEIMESVLRTSSPPPEVSCLIEMFVHNIRGEICHEFDEYLEAENLLRESKASPEGLYDPSYFARPDKYESLRGLTSKLSKEV